MANFDTNSWYSIILGPGPTYPQTMVGTSLYNNGSTGAVFFQLINTTLPLQQWQIFPFNTSYYVLRTKDSSAKGYMNTEAGGNDGTALGNTVPFMARWNISDDSMFWKIQPWGDGTFFFTNARNGSSWHLSVNANSLMSMDSNITAPQARQSFVFNKLGTIDEAEYSSVLTPTSTATSTSSTSTPTSTFTSPSTTSTSIALASPSTKAGLSAGAKAGIGASIAGAAIFFIVLLWFLLYRRRKKVPAQPQPWSDLTGYDQWKGVGELAGESAKSELPRLVKKDGTQQYYDPEPHELPAPDAMGREEARELP